MIPFRRLSDGSIVGRFTTDEVALLRELLDQLQSLLGERMPLRRSPSQVIRDDAGNPVGSPLVLSPESAPPADAALARLLPDAYRDDAAASAEHRRLTEAGLITRKLDNAASVAGSLAEGAVELDEAGAIAWLRALGDLRLALAARLGIESEDDAERIGDREPVYGWLSWLQGSLVEVLDS